MYGQCGLLFQIVADTREEAESHLPPGLTWIERNAADETHILGVWL
jgi:hypothetical protein